MRVGASRSDSGETLVEVLVSLAVLSVAAVAILAGIEMSVKASDIHRKQTTGGAYVRSYAEAIEKHLSQSANYQNCADADDYNVVPVTAELSTLPAGYTVHHTAAVALSPTGQEIVTCAGNDAGVQKVVLTVSSDDGRAAEKLTVVLRRSCEGNACHPTP